MEIRHLIAASEGADSCLGYVRPFGKFQVALAMTDTVQADALCLRRTDESVTRCERNYDQRL